MQESKKIKESRRQIRKETKIETKIKMVTETQKENKNEIKYEKKSFNNLISSKTLLLLESLIDYYKKNINVFTCIITQKNILSLRILDWLVTNYSKKYNIVFSNKHNQNFNVYLDYKNQLKAYSKKYFDPFCRRERIIINTGDLSWKIYDEKQKNNKNENQLITTVGQLNFFKWFIENDVMTFAINNIEKIDKDMMETLEMSKSSPKRKELSKCASKTVCTYDSRITENFG